MRYSPCAGTHGDKLSRIEDGVGERPFKQVLKIEGDLTVHFHEELDLWSPFGPHLAKFFGHNQAVSVALNKTADHAKMQ